MISACRTRKSDRMQILLDSSLAKVEYSIMIVME